MSNSTISNVLSSNVIFKKYLMQLSTGIVWKDTSKVIETESTDLVDIYQTELYITANRGLLNFDIIKSFPRSVLLNASIPDNMIEVYASDKRKIPTNLRKDVVAEYEKALTSINPVLGRPGYLNKITGKYETIYNETNNYYRMLMGLPDMEDSDLIYNTDSRWPTSIPVHELSLVDRIEMERAGILDALVKKYPSKKYINYLGKKYISPFTARVADRFEILYVDSTESDVVNRDFIDAYNSARQIILSVYYNNSFRKSNELYDNFLAMCILFVALQQMQHKYLEVDITRDFYDVESLKLVYDSYSVPFYSEIPLDYHRKIVKNINKLISYKGSSQVFFDLFDIFDLRSLDIYSYFLTKTHIIDSNGMPTFNIKKDEHGDDMYDDEGRPILDESNYKIRFSKVKIYDDPSLSVSDESNNVAYNVLTTDDPYWIEDAELAKKLINEDFNYTESKYLGIQTVFDLMKITFENTYIFRLITDNKELTNKMVFKWNDLGDECSLFGLFIYLAAIYCRFYGYSGIITNHIPALMDTLGLDYAHITDILRKSTTDEILKTNTDLIQLLSDIQIENLNSITNVYDNIEKLRNLIIEGYTNAKTIDEYNAYRDLYNTVLISKEITSVYTNPTTGNLYETFTDILEDVSPILMQRYLLIDDSSVENEILLVTDELETIITSLKYLPLSAGFDTGGLITPLFKILTFFKSAKAELVDYNIKYIITLRGLNFFKMMDKIMYITTHGKLPSDYIEFTDMIRMITNMIKHKNDVIELIDEVRDYRTKIHLKDYIDQLSDMIVKSVTIVEHIFKDEVWYIDFMQKIETKVKINSVLVLTDLSKLSLTAFDVLEARYSGMIKDTIAELTDDIRENTKKSQLFYIIETMNAIDKIHIIINQISARNLSSENPFIDNITVDEADTRISDYQSLKDLIKLITTELVFTTDNELIDKINLIISSDKINSVNDLNDQLKLIMNSMDIKSELKSLDAIEDIENCIQFNDQFKNITDIITKINTIIHNLYKDESWYVDFLNNVKVYTKISSNMILQDTSDILLTLFDKIEQRQYEKIKDSFSKFRDELKDINEDAETLYIYEYLTYLDHVKLITNKVYGKSLKSDFVFDDNLITHDKYIKIRDSHLMTDLIKLISSYLIVIHDDNQIIDKIDYILTSEKINTVTEFNDHIYQYLGYSNIFSVSSNDDSITPLQSTMIYKDSSNVLEDILKYIENTYKLENEYITLSDLFNDSYISTKSKEYYNLHDYLFEYDSKGIMVPVI